MLFHWGFFIIKKLTDLRIVYKNKNQQNKNRNNTCKLLRKAIKPYKNGF